MRLIGRPLAAWRGHGLKGRVVRAYYQALPATTCTPLGHEVGLAWLQTRERGRNTTHFAVGALCHCGWRVVFASYPANSLQVEQVVHLARTARLEHWFGINRH